MTLRMPFFEDLRANYPDDPSPDAVKQLIGGHVDADWITNTCAIRLSRAFNYTGIKLKHHDNPFMHTVSGADNNWYAYRMLELRSWIAAKFGAPVLDVKGNTDRSKFSTAKGVIAFEIHFHDANGHLDLWDGSSYIHESVDLRDYFQMSKRTIVWAAQATPSP
jgi:hypothetical protein